MKSQLHSKLVQFAKVLSEKHKPAARTDVPSRAFYNQVTTQLERVETLYQQFSATENDRLAHSQASEWILDNYYVLQQACQQIEENLPYDFYEELTPLIAPEADADCPRMYTLAREFIHFEQFHLDMPRLKQFVSAYQETAPLTIGELWSLPLWLRFTLLDGLMAAADRLLSDSEQLTQAETAVPFQADETETIAHSVLSLRQLAAQDWQAFVEEVNLVDQILRRDPTHDYVNMVFTTRDQYRKAVERLAIHSNQPETEVASAAIELAEAQKKHVGYFLIGNGRTQLENRLAYLPPWPKQIRRWLGGHPTTSYLGSISLVTLLFLAAVLCLSLTQGANGWELGLVFLVSLLPAMAAAVSLTNWMLTYFTKPRVLPKMDFSEGIPESCRTMVVIPCLLTRPPEVTSLLRQLEQQYLRSGDPQLGFALLSDFADADRQTVESDSELLALVSSGIQQLNDRHPSRPFFLFHRQRLWNAAEGKWMGWERKRGKLHEFNRLLRGASDTSFIRQPGDLAWLTAVRYVITLDADTILPLDAAARLVGTIAHPLNRAQFDENGRISNGYTILQPRTEIQLVSAQQSIFTRAFAGDSGLDLYTRAVSDIYQDIFGEGSYTGKGIYDVDAFEKSLAGRMPENHLLSHDLLEGLHGRAGLVTDIILYEDYPSHFLTYIRRSHRWIRGDWQLLPWLFPRVPSADGTRHNDLSLLQWWKIADNLRRSLNAPAFLLFFLAAWIFFPGSPWLWTLVGLLLSASSFITGVLTAVANGFMQGQWRAVVRRIRDDGLLWLLHIAFLPYEVILVTDAIVVTLWRVFISRRNLLQWTTAAHTAHLIGSGVSTKRIIRHSLPSIILSQVVLILILLVMPTAAGAAAPLVVIWLLSFILADWISRPDEKELELLTAVQQQELYKIARATWLFFEQHVSPAENWLPPDHFQESPRGVVAHRTSPTNIGLYLLSALSARDLGYIGTVTLALRLRDTFNTLDQMERYRGHFLNWIETTTLKALSPRYVSTVDSGNLAGCLLALQQGCQEVIDMPIWSVQRWRGLLDLLELFAVYLHTTAPNELATNTQIERMSDQINAEQNQPAAWGLLLNTLLETELPKLEQQVLTLMQKKKASTTVLRNWRIYIERLRRGLLGMQREAEHLMPWIVVWPPPFANHPSSQIQATYQALSQLFFSVGARATLPNLVQLPKVCQQAQSQLDNLLALLPDEEHTAVEWCRLLKQRLSNSRLIAQSLHVAYQELAQDAHRFAHEMDFGFLYNRQRQVFHIGYNLESDQLDNNFYDLLASEARIASLFAIAKRDVPVSHWLHLARPVALSSGGLTLLSWSGTMFEYLMPPLLFRSFHSTLLHQSSQAAVAHQIEYGRQQQVPWGISESGYYAFDNAQNYQYRAFGVPGLGYKRGLAEDLVIAPYASLLALPFEPKMVLANLKDLQALNMQGIYGFYEAIDYTPSRLRLGNEYEVVHSYMAHHQGMIILALVNCLQDEKMVRRFHANPLIQSVELLLQEQVPAQPTLEKARVEEMPATVPASQIITADPWSIPAESEVPLVHWLSNGRIQSLITNSGSGQLRSDDLAFTRWRPDTTQDNWGTWLYIQEPGSKRLWSAGIQPIGRQPEQIDIHYFPHMVRFRRQDHGLGTQTEVILAPDDDVEIRRLTLTNHTTQTRHLRLTSYAEVALADDAADRRHQAFAKLFVESEFVPELNALIFRQRPRSATEAPKFLAHMLVVAEDVQPTGAHESDRAAFLGRYGTARQPHALFSDTWLNGRTGATLDPVMALGQQLTLAAHEATAVAFVTATAATRAGLLDLCRHYQRWTPLNRAFSTAASQAVQELRAINLPIAELAQAQQLLSVLLYPHHSLRADAATLAANRQGQPGLWGYGISGDYPILLLQIDDEAGQPLLQTILKAHAFWRKRGLKIDLVILNQQDTHYGQPLQAFIYRLVNRQEGDTWLNKRGGIFVVRRDQMSPADQTLLLTAARVVLDAASGSLGKQLKEIGSPVPHLPRFLSTRNGVYETLLDDHLPRPHDLQFDNGYGGFSPDGREYVIHLPPGQATPAPWINVVANETFGFLISENGGGYSWTVNSGENRLTHWRNDPVTDMPAEVLYLRDEETAHVWSPLPQPRPANAPYTVYHGAGYSRFAHESHQLHQETRLFLPPDAPVKIVQLTVTNKTQQPRRLTATYYAEWVLGADRATMQTYLQPWYRPENHALLLKNPYNVDFGECVAFLAADRPLHGFTTDRRTFLGRLGTLQEPDALFRIGLDDHLQPGLDPCGAVQVHLSLQPGERQTVTFLLGQSEDEATAVSLINTYAQPENIDRAWLENEALWDGILGAVQVKTPDPALDLLLNRWLLYQALACRIWGRSALYQSSGAYGFRDQLQDVMALLHTRPDLVRAHLLRAARHQFEAGDVLHWWHPPQARGVRTRITDDLVWLPYVTAEYVQVTGDTAVLDEAVPYLQAEPLDNAEEERYGLYPASMDAYSLYDHCCRALARAATSGQHDLPLMGAGDWNDGMNRVGIEGHGESVWLGWFLFEALNRFADIAEQRQDKQRAARYRQQAEDYCRAIEQNAWDGAWYRRAYYDDGTPLGSSENDECRIDSLGQSWGVLTGAANGERAAQAMASVRQMLVKQDERLILLFTPPFDKTEKDPGYIKGYLPGIRENGGQYTHAALWTIWAFADLGEAETAVDLYRLINPIYRADSPAKVQNYKVEPYVISADVYGVSPHEGRGGWTWYTGSSGWMYRLGIEGILGLHRKNHCLQIKPRLPDGWPGYQLTYRFGTTIYQITVERQGKGNEVCELRLDGEPVPGDVLFLAEDGRLHKVHILLGE